MIRHENETAKDLNQNKNSTSILIVTVIIRLKIGFFLLNSCLLISKFRVNFRRTCPIGFIRFLIQETLAEISDNSVMPLLVFQMI